MKQLEGKNALITGGTKGLGFEVAKNFVREGANVIVCSRNKEDVQHAQRQLWKTAISPDQIIEGIKLDISKIVQSKFDDVMKIFDYDLDILVNNAGVHGVIKPLYVMEECDWKQWKQAINTNLIGSVKMARYALQYMLPKKYGKIIQLSGGGASSPRSNYTAYASSKTAIVRCMEIIAWELADSGVDINSVAPGMMPTRLAKEIYENQYTPDSIKLNLLNDNYICDIDKNSEDINNIHFEQPVKLIMWLASSQSDGITGKFISAIWDRWDLFDQHIDQIICDEAYTLRRINGNKFDYEWEDTK